MLGQRLALNPEGVVVAVTDTCLRAMGRGRAEVIGRNSSELGLELAEHGVRILGSDGELRYTLREPLIAQIRPAPISRSEQRLQVIADGIPAFLAYMDLEGRYQYVNRAYENWFEQGAHAIIGKRRREFATEETARLARPHEEKALAGIPVRYENVLRRPDGRAVFLDVQYLPDLDPLTCKVRGAVVMGHDITERKQALREVELAREHLHDFFMQAPVGICILEEPQHIFRLANATYMEVLFGRHRDLLGQPIRDALPELEGQGFYELLDRVYQTGVPFIGTEVPARIVQSDGHSEQLYVNFNYHPKRNADGIIDGILVIVYNVTEQVKARLRVEQAVQARDEFMSIASHELKTPLTSIQLQTQIARKRLAQDGHVGSAADRVLRLIDQTERSVLRLNRLVDDMLDISRISTGKLSFYFERFDLSDLGREVVERMQVQALEAGTQISVETSGEVIGSWDRFRIEQVITNLLMNAIRYGRGSPVEVRVYREDGFARLDVTDYGPGIAPENQERIFQRFERATPSSSISGMGLGLYISREIADRHGGMIRVRSQLGEGSTFSVQLPLA